MTKTLNHYTQEACNFLNNSSLTVDGIIGNKSIVEINLLLVRLKNKFAKEGWKWNHQNMISIRTSNKFTNIFADWCIITKGESLIAFPISTVAGWGYARNKDYGKKVAVLREGNYPSLWIEGKTSWTGKKYLQQISNCTVYRDGNLDEIIDKNITEVGNFGINFHSWKGFLSNYVGRLSAGCQVVRADVLDLIWEHIPDGKIDYTLIKLDEL